MRLKYRPAAIADIQCTAEYIEKVLKNRSAAQRLKTKILQGASLLKENPQMETPLSSKQLVFLRSATMLRKSFVFWMTVLTICHAFSIIKQKIQWNASEKPLSHLTVLMMAKWFFRLCDYD